MDVEVTASADAITPLVTTSGIACFGAFAHGAFISGIPWTYQIDGQVVPSNNGGLGPNCIINTTSGSFTVTATAGGKSVTVTTTP